jgi:hypothetical protein
VIITNDGSKEAEDVDCSLLLKGSKIQEVKASPDNLNPAVSFDQDKASVKIKLLNVGEFLFVSALVNNPDSLPSDLSPQVRGKGVVGEKAARRMSLADIAVDIDIVFCVISVPFLITAYFIIRKTLERNDARMERSKKDFENAVAVLNEQTAKAKRVLEPIDKLFDCARQLKAHLLDLQGKVPDNLKEELGELVSNLDRIIPVEDGLQSAG